MLGAGHALSQEAPPPVPPLKPCKICGEEANILICCLGKQRGGCSEERVYCSNACKSRDWTELLHRKHCRSNTIRAGSDTDKALCQAFTQRDGSWDGKLPVQSVLDDKDVQGEYTEPLADLLHEHCLTRRVVASRHADWRKNKGATHSGASGAAPATAANQPPAAPRRTTEQRLTTQTTVGEVVADGIAGLLASRVCVSALCCVGQEEAVVTWQDDPAFLDFVTRDVSAMCTILDNNRATAANNIAAKSLSARGAELERRAKRAAEFVQAFSARAGQHHPAATLIVADTSIEQLLWHLYVELARQVWQALATALNGGAFKVPEPGMSEAVAHGRVLEKVYDLAGWLLVRYLQLAKNKRSPLSQEEKTEFLRCVRGMARCPPPRSLSLVRARTKSCAPLASCHI